MLTVALIVLAFLHEPSESDFVRFGMPLIPSHCEGWESPVRMAFRRAAAYRGFIQRWKYGYEAYGRNDVDAIVNDANWRYLVWYEADSLANAECGGLYRSCAAQRLHSLLGPFDFYIGRLPEPWPDN